MAWHRSNQTSKRLDCIPGVGPLLATALVASVALQLLQYCQMRIPRCRDRLLDVALPSMRVHHCVLTGGASMHDIVIRGGTIVDGTGKVAFTGDVAIAGSRIAAVGGKLGPARREIDAAGLLVTPGWVDVHTHYDGQAMWDPLLVPSCWHGVTTVMFGNCGRADGPDGRR
jgi:hypothetical protein